MKLSNIQIVIPTGLIYVSICNTVDLLDVVPKPQIIAVIGGFYFLK